MCGIKGTELIRLCGNQYIKLQEIESHLSDKKSESNYINLKNEYGYTALMICIIANKPDVFELLIKCGADLSIKDAYNRSIYDLLSLWERKYTIPTIEESTTDLMKICSEETTTVEQIKTEISRNNNAINIVDDDGFNALMVSILFNKNPELIKTLVEKGTDLAVKNKYGETALDLAIKTKNSKITKLINNYLKRD